MAHLTAVILSQNEADRIGDCLRSLSFCDAIVVVDSGSTDQTVQLARAAGATVVETDWPGFVAQKNRAMQFATGEWVLSVDADELVDATLATEIQNAVVAGRFDGYEVSRRNTWLGHVLSGGFAWPDRRVRLVRRERACWEGRDPHDRLAVDGPVGRLEGELLHDSYRSLADHLARIERYTRIDARRGGWHDVLLRPAWHLFQALILRRGLRDGWVGIFYALLGALYVGLKWGRWRFEADVLLGQTK